MMPFALHAALVAVALGAPLPQTPASSPQPPVQRRLDGAFDDWARLDPASTKQDRVGETGTAPDVRAVSIASDSDAVWILFEFAKPLTLQGLDVPISIAIDADGDERSGGPYLAMKGSDLALILSPLPTHTEGGASKARRGHGEGTALHRVNPDGTLGEALPHDVSGIGIAPTHASRLFEIRIPREAAGFTGLTTSAYLVCYREREDKGVDLLEEVPIVRALLAPRGGPSAPRRLSAADTASAIARHPDATLRVASWNAERGALFEAPEPFAATLRALGADVVLFQELGPKVTSEELASWMRTHVGGDTWNAVVSGGDLRVGIAARGELANASFLDGVKRGSAGEERPIRVHGATMTVDGKPILLVTLHLKCCGRLGSSEDDVRAAEVEAIHAAVRDSAAKAGYAAIVVAGDFNLVGDPSSLGRIGHGLDLDGSGLDVVNAYQLDGVTNATWRSGGAAFVPGRLDFALVSGASVDVLRSFVFSPEDLASDAVQALALPRSALEEPSDHLPIVFDLRLRSPTSPAPASAPGAGVQP